jgi:hypothetical protein
MNFSLLQALGFIMASKMSALQAFGQILSGSHKVFQPKFVPTSSSGRNRRSADFSTAQQIADISSQVFEAIQKYAE